MDSGNDDGWLMMMEYCQKRVIFYLSECYFERVVFMRRETWSSIWWVLVTEWQVFDLRVPLSDCRCVMEWFLPWSTLPAWKWRTATSLHATFCSPPTSTSKCPTLRCVWTRSPTSTSFIVDVLCRCAGQRPRPCCNPATVQRRRPTSGRSASSSGSCSHRAVPCHWPTDQTPRYSRCWSYWPAAVVVPSVCFPVRWTVQNQCGTSHDAAWCVVPPQDPSSPTYSPTWMIWTYWMIARCRGLTVVIQ